MVYHFYLNKHNSKNKNRIIYLYIRGLKQYPKKTLTINTEQRINQYDWDKVKEQPKRSFLYKKELTTYLEAFKDKINQKLQNILISNNTYTFEELKKLLNEENSIIENNIIKHFNQFIEFKKSTYAKSSVIKYNTIKKHLINFSKEYNYILTFESLNITFFDLFQDYSYKTLKLNINSFKKYIKLFNTFINWCNERELTNINHTLKFKVRDYPVEIVVLNNNEIDRITKIDLSNFKHLEKVRDIFLFSIYTGQRFSDVTNAQSKDIVNGTWNLRTQKTKELIKIPLLNEALTIYEKHKENDYLLPKIYNHRYNNYIKELCKLSDINEIITKTSYVGTTKIVTTKPKYELITSHTARRTFITQSMLRGIPTEIIMKVSGHKDYKTMSKYIAITKSDVETAYKTLWNKQSELKLIAL